MKTLESFPYPLRGWQQLFVDKYTADEKENFLLVATPGAGKTIAALRVAHDLLSNFIVSQIVIVCPTDHLRRQWRDEASGVGLELNVLEVNWADKIVENKDYVGLVTTYAQVINKVQHLKGYLSLGKTLVIFDEIHHCADEENLRWGPGIRDAFGPEDSKKHRRLSLSGTPFREDNNPIPFVKYVPLETNPDYLEAKADFSYGYGDALRSDRVVRRVIFPSWEGTLEWGSDSRNFRATFSDVLDSTQSKNRLRTAVYHEGQWIKDVIKAADKKLDEVRALGYEDAAGLLLAKDQDAAKALAKELERITGQKPTLAISKMPEDMEEASDAIKAFEGSTSKWIVAVKMVSEGVDIKRLHVMVYATNVLTRTFFRQAVGRVIRWHSKWNKLEADQTAWCYAPYDPVLVQHMKEIEREITDIIRRSIEEPTAAGGDGQFPLNFWEFINADDAAEALQVFSSEEFSMDELLQAESTFAGFPGFERLPAAYKAYAIRSGLLYKRLADMQKGEDIPSAEPVQQTAAGEFIVPRPKKSKKEQSDQLRTRSKSAVGGLVYACENNGIAIPGTNKFQTINLAWIKRRGRSNAESTVDEMQAKIAWVNSLTARALKGDKSIVNELRRWND